MSDLAIRFHPAADAFPLLDEKRLAELVADIAKNGLRFPVVLCGGQILDGRNRYLACQQLGLDLRFEHFTGDPWAYVWSANGARRDLVAEQRYGIYKTCAENSVAWQEAERRVRDEANAKRAEAAKDRERETTDTGKTIFKSQVVPHDEARLDGRNRAAEQPHDEARDWQAVNAARSATAKATLAGVSRATVERYEQLERDRPDLAEAMRMGTMKPAEAHRQMKKAQVAGKVAALPPDKYTVIYVDPPWQYSDTRATGDHRETTAAATHYPTMPLADLKALAVKDLAAPDSVLFCWATFPLLPGALELVKAWGFDYKTAYVWDKGSGAFGHYHNAAAELLIVATRGSCVTQIDKREDQIQCFKREGHSKKPQAWRAMIDRIYPYGRRIELFARGDLPENWVAWGNEA